MRGAPLAIAWGLAACGAQLGDPIQADGARSIDAHRIDAAQPPDARACPGSADGSGDCFVFEATAADWATAGSACESGGMHLAIIRSADQNALVLSIIGSGGAAFLGATDAVLEGTFVWVDGTVLGSDGAYTNWDAGEPNNGGTGGYQEDCLVMRSNVAKAGLWDDRPCAAGEVGAGSNTGVYPYVCEFP